MSCHFGKKEEYMLEKVIYRSFKQKDLPKILNLWNKELLFDPITEENFYEKIILDDQFSVQNFLLATIDESIIGFLYGSYNLKLKKSWIMFLTVDEKYQRQNIGTELVTIFKNRMIQRGIKTISLSDYIFNYFTPGVDVRYKAGLLFFNKHGFYKRTEAVSMNCDLDKNIESIKRKTTSTDFVYRLFRREDTIVLLEFVKNEFGNSWYEDIRKSLLRKRGEETIIVALDKKNKKIVGFAMHQMDGNPERFGPIGVKKTYRSKGIGGDLVRETLVNMFSYGIKRPFFLWTSENNVNFYGKYGFNIFRKYYLLENNIQS